MNLILDNWTEKDYENFISYLYSLEDIKYKKFHGKLILDNNLIGIKTPILKNIAKDIFKGNYLSFIKLNKKLIYEEKIIYGLILGYVKDDFNTTIDLFNKFIHIIDNWAICDIVCSNMKIFKLNLSPGLKEIKIYLKNKNPWINRVGIVLLLDHYLNDQYIDCVIDIARSIKSDDYYVNMALAWLISICYIKYPNKTINLLNNKELSNWVHNKSITKITESRRISQIEKDKLKKLKY